MDEQLVTTAFELAGYYIVKNCGIARGITVRSRNLAGNFLVSIQLLFGGDITLLTRLCERTRKDAFDLMLLDATRLGANALIGVRYESIEIAPGVAECLCYGTAVFVQSSK